MRCGKTRTEVLSAGDLPVRGRGCIQSVADGATLPLIRVSQGRLARKSSSMCLASCHLHRCDLPESARKCCADANLAFLPGCLHSTNLPATLSLSVLVSSSDAGTGEPGVHQHFLLAAPGCGYFGPRAAFTFQGLHAVCVASPHYHMQAHAPHRTQVHSPSSSADPCSTPEKEVNQMIDLVCWEGGWWYPTNMFRRPA